MTRLLALTAAAGLVAACAHASSAANGNGASADEHGIKRGHVPVVNDSFPGKAGLVVSLSRASDGDPAKATTVRITSLGARETHQQTMSLKQVARPSINGAFFPGPVDVYGSWFTVAPGDYLVTVERTGFVSRSIDVELRAGFIDTIELTLLPAGHQ
jgi:hypothetical protein